MGLKAIQSNKVEAMIQALDGLEQVALALGNSDAEHWELQEIKSRLIDKHQRYEELLLAIEEQIIDFERLYRQVKLKLLPDKLKKLKTEIDTGSIQFCQLKAIIRKAYQC